MGWQAFKHGAGKGRFASAYFAGEQNKPTFAVKAVL